MIAPQAIRTVVRYLDSVDEAVAARLVRKRPWSEPALTSLLCDLMDEDTAGDHRLRYPLVKLRRRLAKLAPLTQATITVTTHEYPEAVERWVTQADLGLIVRYDDRVLPDRSWEVPQLLQAKRLYKDARGRFTDSCRFRAADPAQHERMRQLDESLGGGFVRHLLYCPRPRTLDAGTAGALLHRRDVALDTQIFDYSWGLALRDELARVGGSTEPGVLVTPVDPAPGTFAEVYGALFDGTLPWAWFIALLATGSRGLQRHPWLRPYAVERRPPRSRGRAPGPASDDWELATCLVRGESEVVAAIAERAEAPDIPFPVLPAHTIEITVTIRSDDSG